MPVPEQENKDTEQENKDAKQEDVDQEEDVEWEEEAEDKDAETDINDIIATLRLDYVPNIKWKKNIKWISAEIMST